MATIEERIVSMKFNNSGFESGVRSTMGLLDRLKAALRLPGAASGIEEMNGAMGRFNVSPIQNGLMGIQNQFSVLQTIATGALLTIGNKVVELGSQLAGGLSMRPVMEGFQEYETKIGSIQTIYANTHEKYGTSYDDITNALDELNTYADQTIYNFGDMTRNIGLFTNAGLELGPSVSMIKGFSNAAAASGTDAQRAAGAAYQLSQGLSQGRITLMDWNSLVNAGMGNAVMKQGLVDIAHAMGTLDSSTMATSEAIENEFRDSLQKGWLSSDVMSTYLQIMSGDMDEATMASKGLTQEQIEGFKRQMEIGMEAATKTRTFSAMIGTIQESVGSGWGQTIEILFGEFEEATELWSGIGDTLTGIIGKSTEARNALLQSWKDLGGRTAILDGLKSGFFHIVKIVEELGLAYREVFPKITADKLVDLSNKFRDFMASIEPSSELIGDIGYAFGSFLLVIKNLGTSIFNSGRMIFQAFSDIFDTGESVLDLLKPLGDFFQFLAKAVQMNDIPLEKVYLAARALFGIFDIGLLVVKALFRQFTRFTIPLDKVSGDIFNFIYPLSDAIEKLRSNLWETKSIQKFVDAIFDGLFGTIDNVVKGIGKILSSLDIISPIEIFSNGLGHMGTVMAALSKTIGYSFGLVVNTFTTFFSSMSGIGDVFSAIGSAIGNAFSLIVDKAGDFAKDLAEALSGKDFSGILDIVNTAIFASLAVMLKQFLGSGSLISQIKEAIFGGDDEDKDGESFLQKAKKLIIGDGEDEGILDKAKESITEAFEPLTDTLETMQNTLKATTLMQIAVAVAALAGSVVLLSAIDSAKLTKALTAITVMFMQLAGMLYVIQAMNLGKVGTTLPLLGLGLMAIAAAINMLVIPVIALSQLAWEELTRGLVGVVGIMAIFATLGPQLSASSKGMISAGIGLSILAGGITTLSIAVMILGKQDLGTLAKGLGSVAILLASLLLFQNFMKADSIGLLSGAGILLLASGLVVMAGAVKILATMSIADTAQSLIALAGSLVILATAMHMMPNNLPIIAAGMVVLSAALLGLSASLIMIASMSAGDSFQSLIVLAGALTILSIGVNSMSSALAGAAALAIVTAALAAFIPILITLGSLPWQVIALGLGAIAAAFVVFAAAGYLLTPVVPTILGLSAALLALSVSITIILGSITLVVGALALLAVGISQLANTGTQALTDLINIIPILFKALADGVVSMLATLTNAGTQIVEFVVTIIQSVLAAIQTTLPQILETVRMAISGLLDLVITLTPQIVETVRVVLTNLLQLVIDMTPQIVNAFITVMQGILNAIITLTPDVVNAVITVCTGILSAISTLTPQVVQTGVDMVMALVNGIVNLIPQLVDAGMRLIIGILDGIAQNIGQVVTKGADVIVNFLQGIQDNVGRVAQEGAETVIAFIDGLTVAIRDNSAQLRESAKSLGWEIINGLTGGLAEKAANALSKAAEVGSSVINKIKEKMGINSPSKYTTEFGKFLMEGLVVGQNKGSKSAVYAAERASQKTVDAVRDTITNGLSSLDVQPTITPIVELSSAKRALASIGDLNKNTMLGGISTSAARDINRDTGGESSRLNSSSSSVTTINFTQNNSSPKSLSVADIYRQTKNGLSKFEKEVFS